MLTAFTLDCVQIEAAHANGTDSFICPECHAQVVLHRGPVRIAHFKHKVDKGCAFGKGETEEHRSAKLGIYNALKANPSVTKCAIEKRIDIKTSSGHVRPDVRAIFHGQHKKIRVAIEIQRSNVPIGELARRTSAYHELGVAVAWLLLWSAFEKKMQDRDDGRYRSSEMERWIHAAYYQRLYCWKEGALLQPVHFESCQNDAGYTYRSLRNVTLGKVVSILDLTQRKGGPWSVGVHAIPERTILVERA